MRFRALTGAVLVSSGLLLLFCFAENVTALKFALPDDGDDDISSSAATVPPVSDEVPTVTTQADDETVATAIPYSGIETTDESVTTSDAAGVSYDVMGRDTGSGAVESKPRDDVDIVLVVTDSPSSVAPENPWIQRINKIPRARNLGTPVAGTLTVRNPVTFGQVISNVLYGAPWAAVHTDPKCADDMLVYNHNLRNFTLWAAKSK